MTTGASFDRLIAKKRNGDELSCEEIDAFVRGASDHSVPDYQLAAMLMAIYFQGMSDRETADLTLAMVRSGEVIDLSSIPGFKADKHSTGGVGDKVTLILGPLLAAAGISFAKLSGRSLGHTGGTLDKLESIPGFRVDLSIDQMMRQVRAIGLAVGGQTAELVPADGVLYALRDVTATVESIPLIASSVMSKKIAAGADCIVLDVKCGRGAFMTNPAEAGELARLMVSIGQAAGKRTAAVVTSMEAPLGKAVGNALEVAEAIGVLRGEIDGELRDVTVMLGAQGLLMAGVARSEEEGKQRLLTLIADGAALAKLREMIRWQGGEPGVIERLDLLPRASEIHQLTSPAGGFVASVDALAVGRLAADLGAGRRVKGEAVDPAVGVLLHAQIGDRVEAGQVLAEVHTNGAVPNQVALERLGEAFRLESEPVRPVPHVLEVVSAV
ncbi:MAG: thymidine phosphorylase [Chloroflexota bacterium]